MAWTFWVRPDYNGRYGRLSLLRSTIVTKVENMLDTVRRLIVRAMPSGDLVISTFIAHKIIIIKKICL